MTEIEPLQSRVLPAEALPVLAAEHRSATSILRYIDTFDQQVELVEDGPQFPYNRIMQAVNHCGVLEGVTEMYLRSAESIASSQVPHTRPNTLLDDSAKSLRSVIRKADPAYWAEDPPLVELLSGVRHRLLPGLARQAKQRQFPAKITGDGLIEERTREIKIIAGYMGNIVVAPVLLSARQLFLAGLESRINNVLSREALNYFGSNFESSTITR